MFEVCLNGGLSEVMLLGFVFFCLFVGLEFFQYRVAG